jgi:hypothetical protein
MAVLEQRQCDELSRRRENRQRDHKGDYRRRHQPASVSECRGNIMRGMGRRPTISWQRAAPSRRSRSSPRALQSCHQPERQPELRRPHQEPASRCVTNSGFPPYPGSNPGAPASHSGLVRATSCTLRRGDISEGQRPRARSLASNFWASCAKGRESRVESLLEDFSISEIWEQERPETGWVSAEEALPKARRSMVGLTVVAYVYGTAVFAMALVCGLSCS